MTVHPLAARLAASTAFLALLAGPTLAQQVGKASAVNPASSATPPGGGTRTLELGANIIFKERIRTTASGNVQLLFVDKTTLNIGPNSDLVIDEFVYDPNGGTGRMAISMAKGVMRFVGGNTSHTGGATVKTPAATLGIRGGVATVRHDPQNGTRAINHFGTLSVTTALGTEVIRRPGFGITVAAPNQAPAAPQRVAQAEINANNQQLTSGPGQSGGAAQRPTEQVAARNNLGLANAVVTPATVEGQRQTVAPGASTTTAAVAQAVAQDNTQELTQQATAQAIDVAVEREILPEIRHRQAQRPAQPRAYALTMSSDPSLGSGVPYLPAGFVASGTFYDSRVLGYGRGGTNEDGTPNRASRFLQGGLNITGQGASQRSTIYLAAGLADPGDETLPNRFVGGFTATTRRAANVSAGRAAGAITGLGSNVAFDEESSPTSARITQDNNDAQGRLVSQQATYFPGGGTPSTTYGYTQTATRTETPSGLGSNRPTAELSGFAGGLIRTFDLNASTAVGPSNPVLGVFFANPNEDSTRFGAAIFAVNAGPDTTPNAFASGYLPFGYQGEGTGANRGAYIDYDNFGARETRGVNDGPFQALVAGNGSSATTAVDTHRGLVATSQLVNAPQFFPGVTFCRCEYTRWGFWSSETQRVEGGVRYQDLLHLGTWVAGRVPEATEIPTTGVATYSGHAIASIKNGSSEYVAAGNFSNTVNFATGAGTAQITNLDGRNYTGGVTLAGAGSNGFFGALSTSGASPATASLFGQFYRGPLSPVQEMGGHLQIEGGPSYYGSGTFAAAAAGPPR